jgi:hypothetical protein
MNSIFTWFCVIGVVVIPFLTGIVCEQKMKPAERELGSRLRRY